MSNSKGNAPAPTFPLPVSFPSTAIGASTAFVASHLGLSAASCAPRWSARLGETGFQILYGLVALLALGTLIAAYGQASHQVYL